MKKNPTLIFTFCLALLLAACGSNDKPAAGSTTRAETAATEKTASNEASASTIGVPACDEYFVKVEKFLGDPNVPQTTRDAYKQTLEQNRTAWKQAAATQQGKAQLETSCRKALDSLKPALEQYGR